MNNWKQTKKARLLLILSCCLIALLTGCKTNGNKYAESGFYFDTIITITLFDNRGSDLIQDCFALASDYEKKFSNTIVESEISQINAHPYEPITVSDDTIALLEKGIFYGQLSQGKFDITIGNVSEHWNFSEISKQAEADNNEVDESVLPDKALVASLASSVDYRKIRIDGNAVTLLDDQIKIDVGGIAKGYIADQMKQYLLEHDCTDGIINLGGNVLTIGDKADHSGYHIGIQKPFAKDGEAIAKITVKDQSVVSSGIYERYYQVGSSFYHHLLDTKTGMPIDNSLSEVTIICDQSMDGDALSTTCFALGLEDGLSLIESLPNTEAIFVTKDETIYSSSGIGKTIPFTKM